jgi:RND family efflux transporter MFP subunit
MKRFLQAAFAAAMTAGTFCAMAGDFECLIEPAQVVEVRSAVDGLIANVHVRRGDPIRRGQPLVELQSTAERVAVELARYRSKMVGAVESARHRVEYARVKLARLAQMQAENFISAQARDEAKAERQLAEADLVAATENQELARIELRRAEAQLALRTMFAPFNGVVLDRMLNPGDLAESGAGRKAVLRIAEIDPLKVDIVVPGTLLGAVSPGARATITPRGLSGRYVAAVTMVDKVIDPASGTFVARVDLPNPSQTIPGGVRCTADIEGVSAPAPAARAPVKSAP